MHTQSAKSASGFEPLTTKNIHKIFIKWAIFEIKKFLDYYLYGLVEYCLYMLEEFYYAFLEGHPMINISYNKSKD